MLFFFPFCVVAGKVYVGNKQEIAENRIPELNTYMKVRLMLITSFFFSLNVFFTSYSASHKYWPLCLGAFQKQVYL